MYKKLLFDQKLNSDTALCEILPLLSQKNYAVEFINLDNVYKGI